MHVTYESVIVPESWLTEIERQRLPDESKCEFYRAAIERELRRRGVRGPLEQVRPQGRPAAESEDDDVETPATQFSPPVYRGDDSVVTWFADATGNGAVSLDYD